MVCEKNNDTDHDFLTDPIETEIDGEWMKAKGTTLGADNGIGSSDRTQPFWLTTVLNTVLSNVCSL